MSDEIKDGGPAFPVIGAVGAPEDYPGLTKRELFAIAVLPGLLQMESILKTDIGDNKPYSPLAKMAYKFADAMIAEGKKTG